MTKKKSEGPDALRAVDALNLHLGQAKGIVRVAAVAAFRDDKDMCAALEAAFEHLEQAKEAASDLWDSHLASKPEGSAS